MQQLYEQQGELLERHIIRIYAWTKVETESKLTVKRDGILYKLNSREPY